jgi:hypothetical protein
MLQQRIDDVKARFYEEQENINDKFLQFLMTISLDFKAKVGKEDIFKPKIPTESLYEIINNKGVKLVNCNIQKS